MHWQIICNSEVYVILFRTRKEPIGRLITAMKLVGGTPEERQTEIDHPARPRADSDQIIRDGDEIYCLTCAIS